MLDSFLVRTGLVPGLLRPLACTLSLLAALLLAGGGAAHAQGLGQELLYDEEVAQSIDRMLICPVCPAETIDQAQVVLSKQMRRIVREMLAQGASREEILDFFVDRYGPQVLAAPPKSGVNLLAWVLPVVGVLAALAAVFVIIRSMASRSTGDIAAEPSFDDDLEPYLEAVDRELTLSQGGNPRTSAGHSGPDLPEANEAGQSASISEAGGPEIPAEIPKEDEPERNG